jgi:predicted dehydrogenase
MNFALLGCDPVCLALARAIGRSRDDALVAAAGVDAEASELRASFPEVQIVAGWEGLLERGDVQAVIVARSRLVGWQQWRSLAQSGVHLLIAAGEALPLLAHYELGMIAEQAGAVFFPLLPARLHPAAADLRGWLAQSSTGGLRSVTLERQLGAPIARFDVEPSLPHLADDVDLLRSVMGDFAEVTALAPRASGDAVTTAEPLPDDWPAVSVQMVTATRHVATWTLLGAMDRPQASLRIVAAAGTAWLRWRQLDESVCLEVTDTDGNVRRQEYGKWDCGEALLQAFHAALATRKANESAQSAPLAWLDATRAAEVTDAALRSLRRGRVITIEAQQPTEEENFKGTMATLGCGALVLAVVLLIVEVIGFPWLRILSYAILALLGGFLLLQLLRWALPEKK